MHNADISNSLTGSSMTNADAWSEGFGDLQLLQALSGSSSDGELLKWQVKNERGEIWWLKSSSIVNGHEMYECESECIACRIAQKLAMENISVVEYNMDILKIDDEKYKVCASRDFVGSGDIATIAEIVPEAIHLNGQKKYECICNLLSDYVQQMNQILIFDAIIYNRDRHLNNLAIVNGEMVLFDNGASLLGRDVSAKLAYNACSFHYQACKPFYGTVKNQLALITETYLNRINIGDIKGIVENYLDRRRSKWVLKLLERNLKEVVRFWK